MTLAIANVQAQVCAHYRIPLEAMASPRRGRHWARPRQIAMWLCRELVPMATLPQIGRKFGGRDHTTVMHACRTVPALMARDIVLRDDVDTIRAALAPPPPAFPPFREYPGF